MPISYVSLDQTHLDAAARLACDRVDALQSRQPRAVVPTLCAEKIRTRWAQLIGDTPCVAALYDGQLVGFLGAFLTDFRGIPTAYVPDWGHGAQGDVYAIYRGLYAALAQRWLDNGCFQHAVTLFAHERDVMEAWISLGFGTVVIDAVIDTVPDALPDTTSTATPPTSEIRRATPEDLDTILRLEIELWRHLARAPAFIPFRFERSRDEWRRHLADPDEPVWLARHHGRPVAFLALERPAHALLPLDAPDTIAIGAAYTEPLARGQGIAGALLTHARTWAHAHGYTRVSVDFESANLEANRFWLGAGFAPVCYSFMRRIDTRLAWANADRNPADVARAYGLDDATTR